MLAVHHEWLVLVIHKQPRISWLLSIYPVEPRSFSVSRLWIVRRSLCLSNFLRFDSIEVVLKSTEIFYSLRISLQVAVKTILLYIFFHHIPALRPESPLKFTLYNAPLTSFPTFPPNKATIGILEL